LNILHYFLNFQRTVYSKQRPSKLFNDSTEEYQRSFAMFLLMLILNFSIITMLDCELSQYYLLNFLLNMSTKSIGSSLNMRYSALLHNYCPLNHNPKHLICMVQISADSDMYRRYHIGFWDTCQYFRYWCPT